MEPAAVGSASPEKVHVAILDARQQQIIGGAAPLSVSGSTRYRRFTAIYSLGHP
ncbi:MAG: hypothetical protein MZW92_01390 [Comamonadaceae bacterium]|nr:hypothetical protein [Comamonadaceae bacterium]